MNESLEKQQSSPERLPYPRIIQRDVPSLEAAAFILKGEPVEDEEAFFMAALVAEYPGREKEILKQLQKYKPHIKDPSALIQDIVQKIQSTEMKASLERANIDAETIRTRIANLIDYFRPNVSTSRIEQVVLVPAERILTRPDSGMSFRIGNEILIVSPANNLDNLDHEFLHGLINPIVEKIYANLSEKQRQRICTLANEGLKADYGNLPFSLLCEELIRTYNDVVKRGEEPLSLESFRSKVSELNENTFRTEMAIHQDFRNRMQFLGIDSVDSLKRKAEEYYNRYVKNELRSQISRLYQAYEAECAETTRVNFEEFLAKNIQHLLE